MNSGQEIYAKVLALCTEWSRQDATTTKLAAADELRKVLEKLFVELRKSFNDRQYGVRVEERSQISVEPGYTRSGAYRRAKVLRRTKRVLSAEVVSRLVGEWEMEPQREMTQG